MCLDTPGDGVLKDFELRMRAIEAIVRLGLGVDLIERGNGVALQLDTGLRVGDGFSGGRPIASSPCVETFG